MTLDGLPVAPAPNAARRILVISPHLDDETLGAGGLIADARKSGAQVTIAFLTNGDGFRVAASRTLGEVNVGPADFVRFAEVRQREAVAALKELGVGEDRVNFLGYPDRGLRPMWEANWDAAHLYRSAYTGHTHSPYAQTFTPRAPYCGASLTADLSRLMARVRPTDILVTHPGDDHPDHNAAPAFAQAALRECEARGGGSEWMSKARVRYYIVHRGDWPLPQGRHPERPLLPPPGLVTRDARWNVYHTTDAGQAAKVRALERYVSQTQISGRFLRSFIRTNELFVDLPTPEVGGTTGQVASAAGLTSAGGHGGSCETASGGAYGDSLVRYVEPGADLTGLAVDVDGDALRVRLTTRGPVSSRLRYRLLLRGAQTSDTGKQTITRFTSEPMRTDAQVAGGHTLEARIPLARLGLAEPGRERCVWVSGESRWANRLPLIDRTGYRLFRLGSDKDGDSAAKPGRIKLAMGRNVVR
jgi:LmbE family N-acetylglucosaminyl deacetylase